MSEAAIEKAKVGTFCPSLADKTCITDLFNATPVIQLVSELTGKHHHQIAGQIALRYVIIHLHHTTKLSADHKD
jgi:hypothetical protein